MVKSGAVVFQIQGAAVMADLERLSDEGMYKLPNISPEYKFGMWHNELLYASKDGKDWGVAMVVCIDDEIWCRSDFEDAEFEEPND